MTNRNQPRGDEEKPPSADELLVMAYVDGELSAEDRARVEERCAREPALAVELAAQRRLAVLAREVAPREPEDHEWARIARSPLGRMQTIALWSLVVLGPLSAITLLEVYCWRATTSLLVRIGVTLVVALVVVVFVFALVSRLRTRPYDPYTGVRR